MTSWPNGRLAVRRVRTVLVMPRWRQRPMRVAVVAGMIMAMWRRRGLMAGLRQGSRACHGEADQCHQKRSRLHGKLLVAGMMTVSRPEPNVQATARALPSGKQVTILMDDIERVVDDRPDRDGVGECPVRDQPEVAMEQRLVSLRSIRSGPGRRQPARSARNCARCSATPAGLR